MQPGLREQDSTRKQLLDAAEALFVAEGIENVSLRAIGRHAGQRNQSALQYHFENRDGLLTAIMHRRMPPLGITPFSLCADDKTFRDIFGLLGAHLLNSNRHLSDLEFQQDAPSLHRLGRVIITHLTALPVEVLPLRIEAAQSAGFLAISRRARRREPFDDHGAALFEQNLVDQISAMLAAPVSQTTLATIRNLRKPVPARLKERKTP